jgi:hypothetical protein
MTTRRFTAQLHISNVHRCVISNTSFFIIAATTRTLRDHTFTFTSARRRACSSSRNLTIGRPLHPPHAMSLVVSQATSSLHIAHSHATSSWPIMHSTPLYRITVDTNSVPCERHHTAAALGSRAVVHTKRQHKQTTTDTTHTADTHTRGVECIHTHTNKHTHTPSRTHTHTHTHTHT